VCEMDFNEAVTAERSLLTGKRVRPALIAPRPAPASSVELPDEFHWIGTMNYQSSALWYLKRRGVDLTTAQELGIGSCITGLYRYRVIIPVYTQGELRTFVARTWLEEEKKKVLMPPGSQAERALFGYDYVASLPKHSTIYLVEGVFDVLRMWQWGFRWTLATLGAHMTPLQQALVKRLAPANVVLLRDGDKAGREAAIKEGRQLAYDMIPVSIAHLPDDTDPGSASAEEIREALDNAKPVEVDYGIESQMEVHSERHI
ncbi:hypothetical protein LCGC14_2635350, partial [marine sediment metagenome]